MDRMAHYEEDAEPKLVPSVTEDDDDDSRGYSPEHDHLIHQVRSGVTKNRHAIAYLLRYETMVRQQEAEDMATVAHIRSCIERIQVLAGIKDRQKPGEQQTDLLQQEVSYYDLGKAYHKLEHSRQNDFTPEFATTDRQLMMLLQLITENLDDEEKTVKITWAEFVHAYKLCITGMETLHHLPADTHSAARSRARNRTLSLISMFEASPTAIFDGEPVKTWPKDPVATSDRVGEAANNDGSKSTVHQTKRSIGLRLIKTLLLTVTLLASISCASLKVGVLSRSDLQTWRSSAKQLTKEAEAHVRRMFSQVEAQATDYLFKKLAVQYPLLQELQTVTSHPRIPNMLASPPSGRESVYQLQSQQPLSGIIQFDSKALELASNPSWNNNVAVPAIVGGVIGAAGAPYAGLLIQRIVGVVIASSTTQFLMATVVAACVGRFFAHVSEYARYHELEFSIE